MKVKNISTSIAIITDMVISGQGLVIGPNQEVLLYDEDTEKSAVLKQYIADNIIQVTGDEEPSTGVGERFVYDDTKKYLMLAENLRVSPIVRWDEAYGYILRIDDDECDGVMTGGANKKTYALSISVTRPSANPATLDSNDATVRAAYSNEALNDTNFIMRGLNLSLSNQSGGRVGMMNHSLGCNNKVGAIAPRVVGLTITPENCGTVATEFGGLNLQLKNEGAVATLEYGLKIENLNNSLATKVTSAILVSKTGANTGFVTGLNLNGVALTNEIVFSNGIKVTVDTDKVIFTNAAGDKDVEISLT